MNPASRWAACSISSTRSAAASRYLRVSVTDRCDFRCVYYMAEEMTFLPKADLLTLEELDGVCSAFQRLAVGISRTWNFKDRGRPP